MKRMSREGMGELLPGMKKQVRGRHGGGGYRDLAREFLSKSAKKATHDKYKSVMKCFRSYVVAEGVNMEPFLAPSEDTGGFALSVMAMELFEGFAIYCVVGKGLKVSVAAQYGTNVRTCITNESGWDLKGMGDGKWGRLTRLFGQLKKDFPGEKRIRLPVLQQDLIRIRGQLNLRTHEDAMYWAVMLMSFFGVNRGGDVLPQTQSGFDPEDDARRCDVSMEGADLMLLDLRENTKTGGKAGDFGYKPYVRDPGNPLCPVTAFENYAALDRLRPGERAESTPLFRHGNGKCTSTSDLLKFLKNKLSAVGLNAAHYGVHSLRIGGATAALSCPDGDKYTVKVMGYWLGDTVRLYTRPTREMVVALQRQMMRTQHTRLVTE